MAKSPKNASNTFSTGGGGVTFEELVGTYYLVSLLAADIPRGLPSGITERVEFQQRSAGAIVDDIIVTSRSSDGEEFKLALQVKHDLNFGNNPTFVEVIEDCWHTFNNTKGWSFVRGKDRLGIVVGVYNRDTDTNLQALFDYARNSSTFTDFYPKLNKTSKNYVDELFRPVLSRIVAQPISDEELFVFLKHLVVMYFDLEKEGAADQTKLINRVLDLLKSRDAVLAQTLLAALFRVIAETAKSGGGFDYSEILLRLKGFELRGRPNFETDLSKLYLHSKRVLESITNTIGHTLVLSRTEITTRLTELISQEGTRYLAVTGQPGYGKSAILTLLAARLQQQSQVLVFSVDRFGGATLEDFLNTLRLQNSLSTLMSALSGGSLQSILIDGVERTLSDSNKKTLLNDLLTEVENYNRRVAEKGSHDQQYWRVIFTCRENELDNVIETLEPIARARIEETFQRQIVEPLGEDDLKDVLKSFPSLQPLFDHLKYQDFLRIPFYLNLATKVGKISKANAFLPVVTEAGFLQAFWKQVLGSNDFPPGCQQTLLTIAERQITSSNRRVSIEGLNSNALKRLISEQILVEEDMHVRFGHDLYSDWTLERLVSLKGDDLNYFTNKGSLSLDLYRPLELRSQFHLEIEGNVLSWIELVRKANSTSNWRVALLGAILKSPLRAELLQNSWAALLTHPDLLADLLRILRTRFTTLSKAGEQILEGVPSSPRVEQMKLYWQSPIQDYWEPVINQILTTGANYTPNIMAEEVSLICEKWVMGSAIPLRAEVGQLCFDFLAKIKLFEQSEFPENEITLEEANNKYPLLKTKKTFIRTVLLVADCLTNAVIDYISAELDTNEGKDDIEKLLLTDANWFQIAEVQPDFFVDVALRVLCYTPPPVTNLYEEVRNSPIIAYSQFDPLYGRWGLKNDYNWSSAAYDEGPFYYFLRRFPRQGLKLINGVVNHATSMWLLYQEHKGRNPIPQVITFIDGITNQLLGDENVYNWTKGITVTSNSLLCCLRALEKWFYDLLDQKQDISEYLTQVLSATNSLAVARVLISIFLKNPESCLPSLKPLLAIDAVWILEPDRLMIEQSPSHYWNMGRPETLVSEARFEELRKLATLPHRKKRLDFTIIELMLQTENVETKKAISSLLGTISIEPSGFFEHELTDIPLMEQRRSLLTAIRAFKDLKIEQYTLEGQSIIKITPNIPEEILAEQEETITKLQNQTPIFVLSQWGLDFRDKGIIGKSFTLEQALKEIEEIDKYYSSDLPEVLMNILEKARACILVGFLIHQSEWLKSQNKLNFILSHLLTLDPMKDSNNYILSEDETSVSRSIALALPVLIDYYGFPKTPRQEFSLPYNYPYSYRKKKLIVPVRVVRRDLMKFLWFYARHDQYEVQRFLFSSLRNYWLSKPKIVYQCFQLALSKIIRSKQYYKRGGYSQKRRRGIIRPHLLGQSIRLSSFSSFRIDYFGLSQLLTLMPDGDTLERCLYKTPLKNFIRDLIEVIIKANNDRDIKDQIQAWGRSFGDFLANLLLTLPDEIAKELILDPLLENWQQKANILGLILISVVKHVENNSALYPTFLRMWEQMFNELINSPAITSSSDYYHNNSRDLLAILIFIEDNSPIIEDPTKIDIEQFTPLLEKWVARFGSTYRGFETLIYFLIRVGENFVRQNGPGVGWVFSSWGRFSDEDKIYLAHTFDNTLVSLLDTIWQNAIPTYRSKPNFLKDLVGIVDAVASTGNLRAIHLQNQIRDFYNEANQN